MISNSLTIRAPKPIKIFPKSCGYNDAKNQRNIVPYRPTTVPLRNDQTELSYERRLEIMAEVERELWRRDWNTCRQQIVRSSTNFIAPERPTNALERDRIFVEE